MRWSGLDRADDLGETLHGLQAVEGLDHPSQVEGNVLVDEDVAEARQRLELLDEVYEVEIRSPKDGALQADGYSDPEDASGYSAHDILSLGFKRSKAHAALLDDTKSIEAVRAADYDALFVAGGQSPMVTLRGAAKLQKLVAEATET